jgi:fluoroacetyl-CoA thioesterase
LKGVSPDDGWVQSHENSALKGLFMTNSSTLKVGLTGQATVTVTDNLTAAALGSGNVDVYSTPAMIALLEAAAINALDGHLDEGQTSVGTGLDVKHISATPVGMSVQATATLREVDGRRLVFEVSVSDEVEQICSGTHERFIVSRERFEQRVREKQST